MKSSAFLLLGAISCPLFAKEFPTSQGRVNDFAGILQAPTKQQLEQLSAEVERTTTAEMAIVTIPSLKGDSVEAVSNRLFKEWGIGKKEKNNGVLILVAPNERKMRIEVGYGLEPILPDGLAGEVIRTRMVPAFKSGDYDRGILDGAQRVAEILNANQPSPKQDWRESDDPRYMHLTMMGSLAVTAFFSVFVGLGFFFLGAGIGSKTFFPILWGSLFGGVPLLMATMGPFGIFSRWVLPPFALFVAGFGWRVGRKPDNFLRTKRLTGTHVDGWTWGASGGSGSSGGSSSGGGFSGGSSGGGGASGSW